MAAREDFPKIGRAHVELQSPVVISYAVFCLKKKNDLADQSVESSGQRREAIANLLPTFTLLCGAGLEGRDESGEQLDQHRNPAAGLDTGLDLGPQLMARA